MHKLRSVKDIWNKYNFILTTPQKRWGVVIIVLTLIGAVCETLGVSAILPLVQVMIEPQRLRENPIMASIIDYLQLDSETSLIWAIGIFVIAIYIIKNLFMLFLSYVRIKYACKVQRELSIEMLESYLKRGYVFFLNMGTGELMRGVTNSISNTYTALYQAFKLLAEILTVICICVYIMSTDIVMAMCVVALAAICLLIVVLGCQKWVKKCGEITYKYTALINKVLLQTFQSIKEILVMHREKYFVDSHKDNYIKQQKGTIGQTVASESPAYIIEAVCVCGLIIAVCIKAIDSDNAATLVPQLASFAVAAFRILPSLGRISSNFNQFMFCVPSINDTYNNLKEARDIEEKTDGTRRNGDSVYDDLSQNDRKSFQHKLSIENISWKYPNTDNNVLDDISIEINKGQSIAFVGKSGAGKTTLADIVLGLLIPQKGKVKIDGIDITDIQMGRNHIIGFVPQNVNLLDDTVRKNVAFGIEDDNIDDELVWKALEQAQLKDIIENSAHGLDTEIGERGIRFSGGQRQRFAIARALYTDPDILILDEATSALDTETETAVMESINALQGHKTLIIIAHRLTTIRNCDKIYEIADGKAIERKYEELG
ncbi:MAG: ABC transporter ATP-binding protein/permease [Butyrivibrio sp.]|nr:ABC transporter ATP-binding protein/permease [Butyrivibrio sp.]